MTHTSQTCISDEQNEMWHLELARNLNCHTGVYREAYTIYQKKWKKPSATTGSARKGMGKSRVMTSTSASLPTPKRKRHRQIPRHGERTVGFQRS